MSQLVLHHVIKADNHWRLYFDHDLIVTYRGKRVIWSTALEALLTDPRLKSMGVRAYGTFEENWGHFFCVTTTSEEAVVEYTLRYT